MKERVGVLWLGLTGGIASGKTTVSKMIQKAGIPVIDADEIARKVVEPGSQGLKNLVQAFGPDILAQRGALNRKLLGEIVFSSEPQRIQLEAILHPLINKEVLRQRKELESRGCLLAFYDVPLLYEKSMEKDFDKIVVVSCSQVLQEKRMFERDKLSAEQIKKRLNSQLSLAEKEKRADIVIKNDGSLQELQVQVESMLLDMPH